MEKKAKSVSIGEKQEDVSSLLAEMDGLFEHFFEWIGRQYDPASGGFYYAESSRLLPAEGPDIESTAQALNIIERCGLLEAMPDRMKVGLITFFRSKQDPASGYFYDGNPAMREDEVMVARAIGYCVNALKKLGAEPKYPLPYSARSAPDYLRTREVILAWLRSVDLTNSWRGCDRLSTSGVYLKQMDQPEREEYLDTALRFFADIQDSATGLWGEGSLYERISGTFKLHIFYGGFQIPIPREAQIYQSILTGLRQDEATDMCYIRNPIHLLSYMKPEIPEAELKEIIRITLDNMRKLLREDGGFSRELSHSPSAPNVAQVKDGQHYPDMPKPVHLSRGLKEGDMNAGTQAVLIRSLCYELAGLQGPSWVEMTGLFYDSD